MIDVKQFLAGIQLLTEEKGIPREKVIEAVETAVAAAYKKEYGEKGQIVRAHLDEKGGVFTMEQVKLVVDESMLKPEVEEGEEEVQEPENLKAKRAREEEEAKGLTAEELEGEKKIRFNPERHIMLDEAKKIKKGIKVGEEISFPLEFKDEYGRIAAQTAKQVIMQKLREIERDTLFEEYKSKEGTIVSGIVQRIDGQVVYLDMGRTVAILPPQERVPREQYRIGERIRVYVVAVDQSSRNARIVVSRSHPRFVSKLFEMEVPEIASGIIEIKAIAREAGSRTKIAVMSHEENVDPIGSCVGQRGTRVATIIQELNGEKIDIIEWDEDPLKFVSNALSPAKVVEVQPADDRHEARVLVPNDQLSLAIGRGGQNVRLAAQLTTWRIDVRSAENPQSEVEGGVAASEKEGQEAKAEEQEAQPEGGETQEVPAESKEE